MNEVRGSKLKRIIIGVYFLRRISESEIKEALKRMKSRKAVGPDGIAIEVWRCLREVDLRWLTNIFNKICLTKKMSNE